MVGQGIFASPYPFGKQKRGTRLLITFNPKGGENHATQIKKTYASLLAVLPLWGMGMASPLCTHRLPHSGRKGRPQKRR